MESGVSIVVGVVGTAVVAVLAVLGFFGLRAAKERGLPALVLELVQGAEVIFGPGTGAQKYEYVLEQAKKYAPWLDTALLDTIIKSKVGELWSEQESTRYAKVVADYYDSNNTSTGDGEESSIEDEGDEEEG